MTKKVWVLAALLALLIAACDQGPGDTQSPAADGGSVLAGSTNFTVSVTGDSETTMPEGRAFFTEFDGAGVVNPTKEVLIYEGGLSDFLNQITIAFPPDTGPGTYDLTGFTLSEEAYTASYETFTRTGDAITDVEGYSYSENVTGTLTIDSIGDTITGSFEFTAYSIEFDEDGQEDVREVRVTGSFTDLPFIAEEEADG